MTTVALPALGYPLTDSNGKLQQVWYNYFNTLGGLVANVLVLPGSTSLTTLGTIITGTWNASIITGAYGGTGINNGTYTITLAGNVSLAGPFNTVGAFATTITSTNTTNATLPAGSTTLVPTSGTGATGTWSISVSGNASTVTTNANLSGPIASSGNTTSVTAQTGTGTTFVMNTGPTLITPLLGTPTSGILTTCTGYTEANLVTTDITTNNVSTSKHGFAPKAPNDATKFLDGTGAYSVPASSSGNYVKISSQTASSSSSITFSSLSTTYLMYDIVLVNVVNSTASGTIMTLGGSAVYTYAGTIVTSPGTTAVFGSDSDTIISLRSSALASASFSGKITLFNPAAAGTRTLTTHHISDGGGSHHTTYTGSGINAATAQADTTVTIAPTSGTFTSGTFTLYGIVA